MTLYQRCVERGCLPYSGGVMDQPEAIMADFDVIDERVAVFKKKSREDAEREAEMERLRRAQRGRN